MLVAVSTVKDTAAHVRRFVAGNLAGGIDHLVVFLDQPGGEEQDEVAAFLEAHPHVTCVRAGRGWWAGERPEELNERQCTNANVVKHVLGLDDDDAAGEHRASWLFHIDGDEVVRIDRRVLDAVPDDVSAVRLAPREAVSRLHWDGDPTWFKRELGEEDLTLLHTLGTIEEASNRAYFHGHLQGKAGVRPGRPGWLTLHTVVDADRAALPAFTDERLEHFHYESYSGEDFVRKWTTMVASGPRASFRPGRARTARALRTLITKDLPPEVLERYLLRIYRATTEDDGETLHRLGLLIETDPLSGSHVPLAWDGREALAAGIESWRERSKVEHFRGASARSREEASGGAAPRRRRGRRSAGGVAAT